MDVVIYRLPSQLLFEAQYALGLSQAGLGEMLGVSRRTINRWTGQRATLSLTGLDALVPLVHAKNPDLARRIATATGKSLESLGVVLPPPPKPLRPLVSQRHLVDSVVCAAAEAAGLTPSAIRPALLAAFERANEIGLSVEAALTALRPA